MLPLKCKFNTIPVHTGISMKTQRIYSKRLPVHPNNLSETSEQADKKVVEIRALLKYKSGLKCASKS